MTYTSHYEHTHTHNMTQCFLHDSHMPKAVVLPITKNKNMHLIRSPIKIIPWWSWSSIQWACYQVWKTWHIQTLRGSYNLLSTWPVSSAIVPCKLVLCSWWIPLWWSCQWSGKMRKYYWHMTTCQTTRNWTILVWPWGSMHDVLGFVVVRSLLSKSTECNVKFAQWYKFWCCLFWLAWFWLWW